MYNVKSVCVCVYSVDTKRNRTGEEHTPLALTFHECGSKRVLAPPSMPPELLGRAYTRGERRETGVGTVAAAEAADLGFRVSKSLIVVN